MLGHSNIIITQEYYGKIVQKRVSEEIGRLLFGYKTVLRFAVLLLNTLSNCLVSLSINWPLARNMFR
jgi:hypothetical protein